MPKAKNAGSSKTESKNNPLNERNLKKITSSMNELVMSLKEYAHELKIPKFGSSLYGDTDCYGSSILPDNHTVVASTIAERIIGKFESPDFTAEQRLRRECNESWITYESHHLAKRKWDSVGIETRSVIYRARDLIHAWLNGSKGPSKTFRYDRSFFKFFEDAPIEFGPGESFIGKRGDVSVFSKLDPYNCTVTEDCAIEAAIFISINKGFRAIFLEVFRKEDYLKKARARASGEKCVKSHNSEYLDRIGHTAFSRGTTAFAARVLEFLYKNNLVQRGSRGSSVYKNSQKRRFINVECFMNVVLQKVAGWALRQCLKSNADCDLDLGQDFHKFLISQPGWSTVDWSNASDSILTWLVRQMFARVPKVFNILDRVRSHFVLIDTPFHVNGKMDHYKMYHHPLKFSSMGNGFTFELLTIINLAIARVIDQDATVYGDDVILRSVYAEEFIRHMQAVGFVPNLKKSFVDLPFRESCGGFFLEGYGYIRSFDFKWNHNIADCIVTVNKLGRIIRENEQWDHPLKDRIVHIHDEAMKLIPATLRGPIVQTEDIPSWVEHGRYDRRHKEDSFAKNKWKTFSTVAAELADMLKFTELKVRGYNPGHFVVVMVPELRKKLRLDKQQVVRGERLKYSYILHGMCSPMLYRIQKDEYKFGFKPTLVHSEGWSIRAATARRITKENSYHVLVGNLSIAA